MEDEELRLDKNKRIADTQRATYERRRSQVCRVFQIKLQANKLSKTQKEQLKMLMVEGKWCRNMVIAHLEKELPLSSFDTKSKAVTHYDKDKNEINGEYQYLCQSHRQTIVKGVQDNLRVLASLKKKGKKVGPLKFCSELNSLEFKQYGVTHKILTKNRIKLQGVKGPIKVNGLKQFFGNPDIEVANWKLLKRPDGYYVSITTYTDEDKIERKPKKDKVIGIDFGCRTSFTTSEGEKLKVSVEESGRIKRLQKQLARQVKGSGRWHHTVKLLRIEYQKLGNSMDDLSNKTIAHFLENRTVAIQDEMLSLWHKNHYGKTVQHSILGRVKAGLMEKDNVVVLSRSVPTTRLCRECGALVKVKLSDKTFSCSCGVSEGRDEHAALNMVWCYENKVGVGRTKFKRVEIQDAIDKAFGRLGGSGSLKREATIL